MPSEKIKNAYVLLDGAERDIGNLNVEVRKFFELKPYREFVDKETKPGYHLYKVELFAPLPDDWPRKVKHICGDLRSALDYAVNRVIEDRGSTASEIKDRNRALPFSRSRAHLESELKKGKITTVCPKLSAFLIDTVKPYNGGNASLCYLDTLNNAKKHWNLVDICMSRPGIGSFYIDRMQGGSLAIGLAQWQSGKNGAVLMEVAADTKLKANFQFSIDVAIAEVRGLERKPLILTLSQITNEVRRLLDEFGKEFFP